MGALLPSLRVAAIAIAFGVVLVYLAHAVVLVRYPWDWSPDEGLTLDYARRLVQAPGTLYAKTVVPVPLEYTPLLTIVLAPVVAASERPLALARVLAIGWTGLVGAGVYALVRPHAPKALALVTTALVLAPLDVSFWYMLVRIDGLMIALWLWAAVFLLPSSLARGADRLHGRRLWLGAALLMAAVLTKPTAVVHGTPLVLAWLWVDARSGLRLAALLTLSGLTIAAALNALSSGGFLWVNGLWKYHLSDPGLLQYLVALFLILTYPILLWVLAGLIIAARAGARPWGDPSILLVLGGLALVPAMSKMGAWWNYLLPALAGLVVLGSRSWGRITAAPPREALALGLTSALAGGLVVTRAFPTPTLEDERTASAYYAFLAGRVAETGQALLTNRPDYPYFHVGQPVEIDGSHFILHATEGLPGTEKVRDRILRGEYSVISEEPRLWPRGIFRTALDEQYRRVGICGIGFFYGIHEYILHVPRQVNTPFAPPPGTRCRTARADP